MKTTIGHTTALSVVAADVQCAPVILDVLESRRGIVEALTTATASTPLPATDGSNRQLLIVLTGNPGIVGFYRDFVHHLVTEAPTSLGRPLVDGVGVSTTTSTTADASSPALDVIVLGFAGHSTAEQKCRNTSGEFVTIHRVPSAQGADVDRVTTHQVPHRREVFSVPDQSAVLDAVISGLFYDSFAAADEGAPRESADITSINKRGYSHIYLCGHSCGTYTGIPVAAKHKNLITRFFMIAPTICDLAQSPKARASNYWMFNPLVMTFAWGLLKTIYTVVPNAAAGVQRLIRWAKPSLQAHLQTALALSLTPSITYNALSLGKSEMEHIGSLTRPTVFGGERWRSVTAKDTEGDRSSSNNTAATRTHQLSSCADLLRSLGDRLVIWCPQKDHWAPLSYHAKICEALGIPHHPHDASSAVAPAQTIGTHSNPPAERVKMADRDLIVITDARRGGNNTDADEEKQKKEAAAALAVHDAAVAYSAASVAVESVTEVTTASAALNNERPICPYSYPICGVVPDPKFPHAWSTHFAYAAAKLLVLPFMKA